MPRDADLPDEAPDVADPSMSPDLLGRIGGIIPAMADGSVDVAGHVRALRMIGPSALLDLAAGCERAAAYLTWLGSKAVVEALDQVTAAAVETARRDAPECSVDPRQVPDLDLTHPAVGDRASRLIRLERSALVAEAALVCGISEYTVWNRIGTTQTLSTRLPRVEAAHAAGILSSVKSRIAVEVSAELADPHDCAGWTRWPPAGPTRRRTPAQAGCARCSTRPRGRRHGSGPTWPAGPPGCSPALRSRRTSRQPAGTPGSRSGPCRTAWLKCA